MTRVRTTLCALFIFSTWTAGCLGSPADTSSQLVNELIDRINTLEKQGQHQVEKMQAMESRLEDQDHRLAVQEMTISDYKHRVADLEQAVSEMKLKQDSDVADERPESDVKATSDNNSGIIREERSEHIGKRLASTRRRRAFLGTEGPIAFHSVIKAAAEVTHLGLNQKIVFPDVLTNLGGGYHNQLGLFVAPQPGIYIFSTSIMADYRDHVRIGADLVKNGHVLARAYAHGDSRFHDQGSVTVVTQLATGDEMWVAVSGPADTSLWGNYYDSFMGCLVVPL